MHRPIIARTLALARVQPSMRPLASPRFLLGQRWAPAIHQPQQLRPFSVLDAVPYLGRRRVDKRLKADLDQALSIGDPKQKQRVFFEVARRFAANNGGRDMKFKSPEGVVSFKKSAQAVERLPPGQQLDGVAQCSVDAVGSHNMLYAIDQDRSSTWKVWVAVDGELRPPPGQDSRAISGKEAVDAALVHAVVVIVGHACEEVQKHFAAENKKTANGEPGLASQMPDRIDLELLVWDTVIPLEVDTRKGNLRTYWVGKLGERRPWKDSWFPVIFPVLFFFDF